MMEQWEDSSIQELDKEGDYTGLLLFSYLVWGDSQSNFKASGRQSHEGGNDAADDRWVRRRFHESQPDHIVAECKLLHVTAVGSRKNACPRAKFPIGMAVATSAVNELSLDSAKQLRKWYAYSRAHELIPSTASTIANPDTPNAFLCLRLDRLEGLRIPRQVTERYGAAATLQICVRISFFHESTRRFFGRTATTPTVAFDASSDGTLVLNAPLYFQTRICDPTAFAVAEPVLTILEPIDGAIIESVALGFCTLNIFGRSLSSLPSLTTMSASRSRSSSSSSSSALHRPLFQGSARALLVIDPAVNWKDRLKATPARLVYDILDASSLRDAVSHLIQDNELITTQSIVAGLPQRALATVLAPPPSAVIQISSPKIAIPEEMEPRALRHVDNLRRRSGGKVVNRRLILGVHNGRRFIHPPVGLELMAAPRNQAFNYAFEGTTTLSVRASFDDPLIVFVVEILLEIEWQTDSSKVPERAVICTGWTARPIYSTELPANDKRINMTLLSVPGRSPSNMMTLAFSDIAICIEVGIQDPNLNAMELPRLLTAADTQIEREQDFDPIERKSQIGEQPPSSQEKQSPPRTKPPPSNFLKLAAAPAAILIDGALPNYDISLELEVNDPLKAARYQVTIEWIESMGAQPFTSIVMFMHIFGEKALVSNPVELSAASDFITGKSSLRQNLSISHAIFVRGRDHDEFVSRIYEQNATLEVWDYKSQMLIGHARMNLRHTLRQRQPSIEARVTVNVEDSDDNVRGRLGIMIRHFGLPEEPDSDYDAAIITQPRSHHIRRAFDKSSEIIALSSNLNSSRSAQPMRVIDRHAILGDKLAEYGWHHSVAQHQNHVYDSYSAHADQRAKLRHLKPIVRPPLSPLNSTKMERGLALIDDFRSQMKQEGVKRLMHQQCRKIRTRFGEAVLFRARLKNPYRQKTRFMLRLRNHPDEARLGGLRLVTTASELRHCQSLFYDANSNDREADRLGRVALLKHKGDDKEILLELGVEESILFCFCFQLWDATSIPEPYTEKDTKCQSPFVELVAPATPERRQTFSSEISIENADNHNYVSGLKLQIEQAPFLVDVTFRFYHFNNEILKASLPLSRACADRDHRLPLENRFANTNGIAKVRCTNDAVAFEFSKSDDGFGVLNFRYACGQYPEVDLFYLLLFEDEFCFSLRCIWKVLIYSRPRIDVNAIVGASQIVQACLPPVNLRNLSLAVGFSSDPSLLNLEHGSTSFELVSNALNQIGLLVRPNANHTDGAHVLVNLLDASDFTVVYSWLVEVHITFPPISTSFDVALSLGSTTKKKIRYKNGYNEDRVFKFESSNPRYLQVITNTVKISANEEGIFVLSFPAQSSAKNEMVYVFINDAQDHNEECLSFSLTYGVRRSATEAKRMSI